MASQVVQIHRELEYMLNAKRFEMSQSSRDEYMSIAEDDWIDLIQLCMKRNPQLVKQKDIIILRLYLTFMGRSQAQEPDDAAFLELFALLVTDLKSQSIGSTYHKVLDPERVFVISEDNKKRIKELLVNLQREKLLEDEKSNASMNDTVHAS